MSRFIRFSAIGFTLFSMMFWLAAQVIMDTRQFLNDYKPLSGMQTWLTGSLPPIIYALISFLFFHWFARKVIQKDRSAISSLSQTPEDAA